MELQNKVCRVSSRRIVEPKEAWRTEPCLACRTICDRQGASEQEHVSSACQRLSELLREGEDKKIENAGSGSRLPCHGQTLPF